MSVSVIGWVATIFGGLGVLGGFCTIIQREYFAAFQPSNPIVDVLYAPGAMWTYTVISQAVSWLVSVLLLIAGIGCLKLKPRSRRLMNGIAIYQLIVSAIGIVVSVGFVYPALNRYAAQHPNNASIQMTLGGTIAMQAIAVLLGASFSIATLYFLSRPHVKEAFESTPPPPAP